MVDVSTIDKVVEYLLRNHRPFFQFRTYHQDCPEMVVLLDYAYIGQLVLEAVQLSQMDNSSLEQAVERVIHWRGNVVQKYYEQLRDHNVLKVFGSARSFGWCDLRDAFTKTLAGVCVPEGIGVATGGADSGVMGMVSRIWHTEVGQAAQPSSAVIIAVLLKLSNGVGGKTEEPLNLEGIVKTSPFMGFQLRTSCLQFFGNSKGHFYYPGGLGSNEELGSDLLARQMAKDVTTTASHNNGSHPPLFLVDVPTNGGATSFWSPTIGLLQNMLEDQLIDERNLGQVYNLRMGCGAQSNSVSLPWDDWGKQNGMVHEFEHPQDAAQFALEKMNVGSC